MTFFVLFVYSFSLLIINLTKVLEAFHDQFVPWCSVQFSSVAQSCSTLCDPMNHSTPGLPVQHQLPEPTQTHIHWVGDAIQLSYPLSSPSPPAFNLQPPSTASGSFLMSRLLASGGQSIGASASASVLPMNIQAWFPLGLTDLISLQSKDSQESSPAPRSEACILQLSAFFMVHLSHPYMTTGKTIALTRQTLVGKLMSLLFKYAI